MPDGFYTVSLLPRGRPDIDFGDENLTSKLALKYALRLVL